MSDKTFEAFMKSQNMSELIRENADSEFLFQEYSLSKEIAARLESIRKTMYDENIAQANPMWKVIAGEDETKIYSDSEDSDNNDESNDNEPQMIHEQSLTQPSTQFFFTQSERTINPEQSVAALSKSCDILECAYESLERNNGRLDFTQLDSLSSEDIISLMDEMAEKLSLKGIYNLCQSMNDMTIEQKMRYLNVLCTHLLLPKIIKLEEPSRLLSSAIGECIKKFPDEVQQFIFIPILNAEIKDTTLITDIVNTFDPQKRTVLLEEFLAHVEELKSWHISILQNFLSVRLDHNMTDKVIKLFSEKALRYSKDKNFGKLVLSFLKINTALSEEQVGLMTEVAAVNETLFKKPIETILKNI